MVELSLKLPDILLDQLQSIANRGTERLQKVSGVYSVIEREINNFEEGIRLYEYIGEANRLVNKCQQKREKTNRFVENADKLH